jgi:hypothetical protein
MSIRLRDDVFFSDPESRIREYCEIEVYFGYDDKHSVDNIITQSDIDAANELYAMIDLYFKGTSRRILDKSSSLAPLLSSIPHQPIDGFKDNEWSEIKKKIVPVLKAMTSIYGVGVPTATKILHLKRPQLFPVLDAYVVQFLTGKPLTSSPRDIDLALKCLDITREIIVSQQDEFNQLWSRLSNLPIELSIVRLFDILCWSTYKWDILGRTNAPRGKASKSLIGYKRKPKSKIALTPRAKKQVQVKPTSDSNMVIVYDFFSDLSKRAKYRIHGEKPVAVLAVLEYLLNTGQEGIRFLDLLDTPYYEKVRKTYLKVAEKYASLSSPSGSWSVITGTSMELQNAIRDNGNVNQAVADLTREEIETLRNRLLDMYRKTVN